MLQDIKKGLKKRKVKVFLIFLGCSFSAWFISNLSESFRSTTTFHLNFVNIPENKILIQASKETLDVKLEAIGFQFLLFNFKNKTIDIDLSKTEQVKRGAYIAENQYQRQIEKQLANPMKLVEIVDDTIFFDFQNVITKEVLVKPLIDMSFEQNYYLEGQLTITPSTVRITGPVSEVDTISSVRTFRISFQDLAADFSDDVGITKSEVLTNTTFSVKRVALSGKVSKFSEKMIQVPIEVINLPKDISIRTFPEKTNVLCKASIKKLKQLKPSDFKVTANFNTTLSTDTNILQLTLSDKPDEVYKAILVDDQVEFILKKE